MKQPHDAEESTSRVQSLPGELRNRIYRLVAVTDGLTPAVVKTEQDGYKALMPGLAATCRSIRNEMLPIYYAENTFAFYPDSIRQEEREAIRAWIQSLGPYVDRVTSVAACSISKPRPDPQTIPFPAARTTAVRPAFSPISPRRGPGTEPTLTATIASNKDNTCSARVVWTEWCLRPLHPCMQLSQDQGLVAYGTRRVDVLRDVIEACCAVNYGPCLVRPWCKECTEDPARRG